MTDFVRRRLAILLFLVLCSAGSCYSVWQVRDWGDRLSIVDDFSEANALREVRNFLEQGLTRYDGLGNVLYPGMYPDEGFAHEPKLQKYYLTSEGVYTHYPAGAEYLLYAAAKLFGPEPVSRLRLLPISIGWAAMLFLGLAVRRRFGAAVGWMVMTACVMTPAVTDGFVGLHYQGYAFALLLVEIGAVIATGAAAVPFALLGFLQGWLSFDYIFLVALVPLALELAMPKFDPGYQRRWARALTRSVCAGVGFTFALALHFLQVSAYLGSVGAALHDFAGAAERRVGMGEIGGPLVYLYLEFSLLKLYFVGQHPLNLSLSLPDPKFPENWAMFRVLGLSLGPWWAAVTIALMLWDQFVAKPANRALRMDWYLVCAAGVVTSTLWLLVMPDHAGHHRHFLYRHLFFAFFVAVLFGATAARRAWIASAVPTRLSRWGLVSGGESYSRETPT